VIVLLFATPALGQTVTLSFGSLPSDQGWVYEVVGNGVTETEIFSFNGTELHQDSLGVGFSGGSHNLYYLWDVVNPSLPLTLAVRARVTASASFPGNAFGFSFAVHTGTEIFGVGLSTTQISDINGALASFDNAQYHDYLLKATPGVGYELFVDGGATPIQTGPPRLLSIDDGAAVVLGSNYLWLGDATGGANAVADVQSLVFSQEEDSIEEVAIDIKPGSHPNSINLGSNGSVPVAILGSPLLDVGAIDPLTVTLASAPVRLKGKGTPMTSIDDVNGDGLADLVVHVSTQALSLNDTDTQAVLEGELLDGTKIRGVDSVRVVP